MFGWKGDALQRAMDAFCSVNCLQLKTQTTQAANRCTVPQKVPDPIDECKHLITWATIHLLTIVDIGLLELPGGVQISYS